MPGTVVGIHVAAREGAPMQGVSAVECRADFGLVGDRCAKPGAKGQITVVSDEQLSLAGERLGAPIAPGATRRNVTVRGVELPPKGGRLRLGCVLIEVVEPATPCNIMNKCIAPGAKDALQGLAGVRARILSGGTLSVGDDAVAEPSAEGTDA